MRNILLIGFLAAIGHLPTQAQWEVGGVGGVSVYWGDLNPTILPHRVGPAGGLIVRRNFDGRLCLRLGLSYANIGANDKFSKVEYNRTRNLSFQTDIFEASVMAEFNFLDFNSVRRNREDKKFTSYLSGGMSLFAYTPKAFYEGAWYKLRPLGTEGQAPGGEYSPVAPAVLVGGGFKWKVSHNLSLNLDIMYRVLFTDYIDDVSGTYADWRVIQGHRGSMGNIAVALADRSREVAPEPIGQTGRQRGDARRKDSFMSIGIGISYNFTRLECPAHQ